MTYGRINLIAGSAALCLATLGGMALGATFDAQSVKDGLHLLSVARFYLREGHSHGMPIALLNLILGSVLDRLALAPSAKRIASAAAITAFMLPIGLAAKGAAGAPAHFPPIGLIGVLGFVTTAVLLLVGSVRLRAE